MHRADIVAAVKKAGLTMTELSKQRGLSPGACSKALTARFPAAERAIAECIGLALHEIWPDRYSADGGAVRETECDSYDTQRPRESRLNERPV